MLKQSLAADCRAPNARAVVWTVVLHLLLLPAFDSRSSPDAETTASEAFLHIRLLRLRSCKRTRHNLTHQAPQHSVRLVPRQSAQEFLFRLFKAVIFLLFQPFQDYQGLPKSKQAKSSKDFWDSY